MKLYLALFVALISIALALTGKDGEMAKTTGKWGSYYPKYPKYCYKDICKDEKTCKAEECDCVDIEYVCGCDEEKEYYFKKYGYGGYGGYGGHPTFYKKTVCIKYKTCDHKKCETCHKCSTETKCHKVKVPCYHGHY